MEDIRFYEDEKKTLNDMFQQLLSAHPLLSSYSNVISILYQTLKKLSKVTGIVTYSWKTFLSMVDMIVDKTVRELMIKVQG